MECSSCKYYAYATFQLNSNWKLNVNCNSLSVLHAMEKFQIYFIQRRHVTKTKKVLRLCVLAHFYISLVPLSQSVVDSVIIIIENKNESN